MEMTHMCYWLNSKSLRDDEVLKCSAQHQSIYAKSRSHFVCFVLMRQNDPLFEMRINKPKPQLFYFSSAETFHVVGKHHPALSSSISPSVSTLWCCSWSAQGGKLQWDVLRWDTAVLRLLAGSRRITFIKTQIHPPSGGVNREFSEGVGSWKGRALPRHAPKPLKLGSLSGPSHCLGVGRGGFTPVSHPEHASGRDGCLRGVCEFFCFCFFVFRLGRCAFWFALFSWNNKAVRGPAAAEIV